LAEVAVPARPEEIHDEQKSQTDYGGQVLFLAFFGISFGKAKNKT